MDARLGVLAEMSSNKSDRSMSPSTLSEEGRRELIARQHRALYGNEGPASGFTPQGGYSDDGNTPRDSSSSVPTSSAGGMRGNSPRGMDPFGMGQAATQSGPTDNNAQDSSNASQESTRNNNNNNNAASPAAGTAPGSFTSFESASQQAGKPSTSPTGGTSPTRQVTKSTTAPIGTGMGPIGSRPQQQQAQSQGLNKRSTSPLPSLSYSFGSNEQNTGSNNNNNNSSNNNNERAGSSNSNNNTQKENSNASMGAWGTGSGVWGSNKIGATSVWG
jgi:hypothetical protein